MPVADTLKRTTATAWSRRPCRRADLHAAQTPQGFPFWPILAAHEKAFQRVGTASPTTPRSPNGPDPGPGRCGIAGQPQAHLGKGYRHGATRALGGTARFRMSGPATAMTCMPLSPAATWRFAASRSRTAKAAGHSDADVGLHALTDALLATCGAGDIGTHFPPSDPQWKGVSSKIFVEHAAGLVRQRGGRIANADVTLICEAPRIGSAPRRHGRGGGRHARPCRRPRIGQGDDQRAAGIHRPRGRHCGDRHGNRDLSGEVPA